MGWPLRMFQEEGYSFVTSRCFQGRLLLRPSAEVNEVVGGVLARAVQQSAGTVRKPRLKQGGLLCWGQGPCEPSTRIPVPSASSGACGRWGMPPRIRH
jgi:hypothetical protein